MIGLDTNVLLRVLVDDGSPDVARARDFVAAQAQQGGTFFIDTVVLVKTVWVVKTAYGYERADIGAAIDAILANAAYVVDGRETVAAALAQYRGGKADFSDCLMVARHAAGGCIGTASPDETMRHLPGVIAL